MQRLLFTTILVLPSCAGGNPGADVPAGSEPAPKAEMPRDEQIDVDGAALVASWRPEQLTLPPAWAPNMPSGKEDVRFAPGMFDASAEDYWTYVFRIDFDEELSGEQAVQGFLEQYYDGLLGLVGRGRGLDMGDDPAQVHIENAGGDLIQVKVDLIDAFVTGEPLLLYLDWKAKGKTVHVTASPQPRSHEIWQSLRAIEAVL